jgi:hypothetical protein
MTYTRSGNALATSSTLLKYCTGSFISRSCSSSLNCPKTHDKRKRCKMFMLDSCHRGDSLLFLYANTSLSYSLSLKKNYQGRGFVNLEYIIIYTIYKLEYIYSRYINYIYKLELYIYTHTDIDIYENMHAFFFFFCKQKCKH